MGFEGFGTEGRRGFDREKGGQSGDGFDRQKNSIYHSVKKGRRVRTMNKDPSALVYKVLGYKSKGGREREREKLRENIEKPKESEVSLRKV